MKDIVINMFLFLLLFIEVIAFIGLIEFSVTGIYYFGVYCFRFLKEELFD